MESKTKETERIPAGPAEKAEVVPPVKIAQMPPAKTSANVPKRGRPKRRDVFVASPTGGLQLGHFASVVQTDVNDEFLEIVPVEIEGVAFTSPSVMDKAYVSPLNQALCTIFEAKTKADRSRVISAFVTYFAVNSTTPRLLSKEKITVYYGNNAVEVPLDQIQRLVHSVTGETELRRVLRAYADFTRDVLSRNITIRTHLYMKFNLSDNYRHIAFDFAEYCENPPLSGPELEMLAQCKAKVISETQDSDRYQMSKANRSPA